MLWCWLYRRAFDIAGPMVAWRLKHRWRASGYDINEFAGSAPVPDPTDDALRVVCRAESIGEIRCAIPLVRLLARTRRISVLFCFRSSSAISELEAIQAEGWRYALEPIDTPGT